MKRTLIPILIAGLLLMPLAVSADSGVPFISTTQTITQEIVAPLPVEFEETFTGTLPKRDMRSGVLYTIPGGATSLEITLEATDDVDLELYDGNVFVVGWGAMIDSQGTTLGIYKGDTFSYSGWDGPDEYITSTGPLARPYDLRVFAYEAGSYTVTVSYVMPAPDVDPPAITIDVADVSLGAPVTIEVSANDLSSVKLTYFGVWPVEYPEGWDSGDPVAMMCTFADEACVTFVPGWAGSYTVKAWAVDNVDNSTPEDAPVEVIFSVVS